MKTVTFTSDQRLAIKMAKNNNGQLIRFGDGAWSTPGYKWRGRQRRNVVARPESIHALVRRGLMHFEGYVKGKPTIVALVDYPRRKP